MSWGSDLEVWGSLSWGEEIIADSFRLSYPNIDFSGFTQGHIFNIGYPSLVYRNFTQGSNLYIQYPSISFSFIDTVDTSDNFNIGYPSIFIELFTGVPTFDTFSIGTPRVIQSFSDRIYELSDNFELGWPNIYARLVEIGITLALVVNTDLEIGPTEYRNFDYNSLCQDNEGNVYLASSTGLHKLTGISDNSTDIETYFETPTTDFGVNKLKNIPEIYIGMKTQSDISAKTKHDDVYSMPKTSGTTNGEMITKRIRFGRGTMQRYWGLRIHSETAPVEIDHIEVPIYVKSRRINE